MEPGIVLVILVILGIPLALAIWLIARAVSAENRIGELSRRLGMLESEMMRLRREAERQSAKSPEPATVSSPARRVVETISASRPEIIRPAPAPVPPPKPVVPEPAIPPLPSREMAPPVKTAEAFAKPLPPPRVEPAHQPAPKINWEQFMGVKGFAWLGGFALFLGVAFFVKYSFDKNLIPPALRVAVGFLTGLGLLAG
ncbi:MAG TPA: DUF2339 domain-containing protein, partial [Candidatus Paceibacterota bacterium]|nr:DUF2339 domain-containing protein [Candidatus Paceibacterota bacterium]